MVCRTIANVVAQQRPSFQAFAELLSACGHGEARRQLLEKFPTAGMAVINFPFDAWDRVHPRAGRLDRMLTPASLAEPAD
jgi:phosphohistidine phosphatase